MYNTAGSVQTRVARLRLGIGTGDCERELRVVLDVAAGEEVLGAVGGQGGLPAGH